MNNFNDKITNIILEFVYVVKQVKNLSFEFIYDIIRNYNSIMLLCTLLLIVCTYIWYQFKKEQETPFTPFLVINIISHIALACTLGYILKFIDISRMTQFLDIYWSFGFYLFFFFLIVLIKELIQFVKSSNKITRNFARAYYFLGLSYIFAAIASDQLIVVNDLLLIVLFVFGWMGLQLLSQEKKVKYDDSVDEESDVEITSYNQLLATRKKEFARITDLLRKNNYDEPFALLLNGNWGVGKTSLINVLTKKLEDEGNFKVFIQPLILDTTEKQMDYFFGQLEEMLNSNGIYTGKDSPFKKYVNILFQTINTLNMKQVISLDGLLDSLNNDEQIDFRSSKIRLENDIQNLLISKKLERKLNKQSLADKEEENLISSETKKKIYIIIDDFDRVEEETFKNTLVFIKELVNFKGVNCIWQLKNVPNGN